MGTTPVTILKKESYLAMVKNAVGTNQFRTLYALVDGQKQDVLHDGERSCAVFVSSILLNFHLIAEPHSTVAGLERDLKSSGWSISEMPHPGDMLVWEPMLQAGEVNAHIGFFMGNDRAISNNWQTRVPAEHHMTYGTKLDGSPMRAITAIYTNDILA